jgi:hypothetical protein
VGYEWVREVLDKLQGVEPHEVVQALSASPRWPRSAITLDGLRVLTVWGRTRAGRPLMVGLRHKDEWTWWIVGARELSPDEVAELENGEGRDE